MKYITILVYVDDMVLTGNDETEIKNVKIFLNNQFYMKDLGKSRCFLVWRLQDQNKAFLYANEKHIRPHSRNGFN